MKLSVEQLKWLEALDTEYIIETNGDLIFLDSIVGVNFPEMKKLPIKIKKIIGNMDFEGMEKLETLENSPDTVEGFLDLRDCKKIKTLEGGPRVIDGWLRLENCSALESLDGIPEEMPGNKHIVVINCPMLPVWVAELAADRNSRKISHSQFVENYYLFRNKPKLVQAKNLGLF
jgi:hypothetical protein